MWCWWFSRHSVEFSPKKSHVYDVYLYVFRQCHIMWSIPSWDRRPSAYPSPSGPRYWPCSQAELVMFWRNLRGNPREWTGTPLVGIFPHGPSWGDIISPSPWSGALLRSWLSLGGALKMVGSLLCRYSCCPGYLPQKPCFILVRVLFLGTFWTKNPKFSPKQVLVFSFLHIF
jgi:hypothetical protein